MAEASAIGADKSTEEPAAGLAEQRCRPVKVGGALLVALLGYMALKPSRVSP